MCCHAILYIIHEVACIEIPVQNIIYLEDATQRYRRTSTFCALTASGFNIQRVHFYFCRPPCLQTSYRENVRKLAPSRATVFKVAKVIHMCALLRFHLRNVNEYFFLRGILQ
jgi:hypothetical protein